MIRRYAEAREAMAAALKIRQLVGVSFDHPVAIIDVALQLGILVSFKRISSMEGMWCKEKRAIILTSLRPAGRRAFTCAHEIAHYHFNHGTKVDELLEYTVSDSVNSEEYLANEMAAQLLMPFYAVSTAIQIRKWNPATLTAPQLYSLASHFGASYGAILNHLHYALRLVPTSLFEALNHVSPKAIRSMLCPGVVAGHLVLVDEFWQHRPIDLEVGDLVILPKDTHLNDELLESVPCRSVFGLAARARSSGLGYLSNPNGSRLLLRIIPKEYEGFADYRFPEHNNVYCSP